MQTETTTQDAIESFDKPSFDGREKYHDVIKKYLLGIAEASIDDNHVLWIRLLRGLFSLLKGYIRSTDVSKIETMFKESLLTLNRVYGSTTINKRYYNVLAISLDNQLNLLQDELYGAAKHIFLPIKEEEDDTEFNLEKFFAESDL